jgi:hypothetical protein
MQETSDDVSAFRYLKEIKMGSLTLVRATPPDQGE